MEIEIGSIDVGVRRREALGEIPEMMKSLKRCGLLHPIVVSGTLLVCGMRRLEAAKQLGWETIAATDRGELTPQEMRMLELEENEQRKDLTAYERSKNWRDLEKARREQEAEAQREAELAAANGKSPEFELTAHDGQLSKPKHRPAGTTKRDSDASRAERMGTKRATVQRHDATVEYSEKYPFMQRPGWTQAGIIKAGKALDKISEDHSRRFGSLVMHAEAVGKDIPLITTTFTSMPEPQRERTLELFAEDKEDEDRQDFVINKLLGNPPPSNVYASKLIQVKSILREGIKEYPRVKSLGRALKEVEQAEVECKEAHEAKFREWEKRIDQ